MEFSGDEKRIQALFSELSLEDRNRTPRFEKLWLRSEATAPAPVALRFVTVLAAMMIVAVLSLAARSWVSSSQHTAANIPPQIIHTTSAPVVQHSKLPAASKDVIRPRRFARRQTERTAISHAALLSNWQSPTNILLNSPTVSVLSSLPKLDQSAKDLEQFLPKNNELIKESKQ